jgi:CubicO group peptidase (beta-lactamase class C family)
MKRIFSASSLRTVLTVLLAAWPTMLFADARNSPEWKQLVAIFDKTLQDDHIVGGSVALVENGRIVARKHHGFADKQRGRRVDDDTVFHWASITKTLNAIAVMQLRDDGQLSLEDAITRYVPELRKVHNPFGSMDSITVRMLMDHSAGFQASTWPYKSGKSWEPFEPTEWSQVVAMMPYQQIAFEPGSRYSYSNPSWIYLAHMLEQVSGDPWEAYIQEHIFAPLGMSRSYFGLTPNHLRDDRSHRYVVRQGDDGKIQLEDLGDDFDPGITIPNGGWNSPLDDVAAYIAFLTRASRGDKRLEQRYEKVLKQSSLEEMWERRHPTSDHPDTDYIGLGFFILGDRPERIIGHTGGQGGFSSFFYFNPVNGRGVVAAFNTANVMARNERGYFAILREQALKILR